jgi:phosphate starvation-inducible protein PhoH
VVRHPLVSRIVRAYGKVEERRKSGARYEKKANAETKLEAIDDD